MFNFTSFVTYSNALAVYLRGNLRNLLLLLSLLLLLLLLLLFLFTYYYYLLSLFYKRIYIVRSFIYYTKKM